MAKGMEWLERIPFSEKTMHMTQNPCKVIPISPKSNSQETFIYLYNNHYERVKQYAFTFYETTQDAEDVAQNVFMKLWERRDRLHQIVTIEGYLFTMTRNQFINDKRSLRRKKAAYRHLNFVSVSNANLTEQDVFFKETKRIVNNGINQLPLRMKIVLMLKRDGYNRNEISSSMGIHSNTVKNHLHTAVCRIEACLQVI